MGSPTRRGFPQKTSIGLFASFGGCASIGNDEEKIPGILQIENEDDEQHQFQVTISELVPRTNTIADTPTDNPSPGIYQENTYLVESGDNLRIANLNEQDGPGYVMISAAADTGPDTERWISLWTRFIWTLVLKEAGNLTWRATGIE